MLRSKAKAGARQGYFADNGPATGIRGSLRFLNFRLILFGGILAMSACSSPQMTDADFEKLCKEEAYVKILDPILWERYVKLATENSARIDGKPTLVEVDGFTVLFDENRGATSSDFPIGIHDQETVILYNGIKIAILFEKIRTVEGYYGAVSRGCYWFSGLETYIKNRKPQ